MRYHRDIHKAGTTVYRWSVIDEAPAGYDERGEPWYDMQRDAFAGGDCDRLGTAKMLATTAARRHDWQPHHLAEAAVDRVAFRREDINDRDYGLVAWLDEVYDEDFNCWGYWNRDTNRFDWDQG